MSYATQQMCCYTFNNNFSRVVQMQGAKTSDEGAYFCYVTEERMPNATQQMCCYGKIIQ